MNRIRLSLRSGPTFLHPEEGLAIIRLIMLIPSGRVLDDPDDFMAVMDDLYTSHVDAAFEITDETLPEFLLFADWLDELAKICASQRMKELTLSMAEHFRIDPKNIKV